MCGLRFMITIFYAFKDTYTSACTSYLQLHVLMLISPRLETMVKKKKKKRSMWMCTGSTTISNLLIYSQIIIRNIFSYQLFSDPFQRIVNSTDIFVSRNTFEVIHLTY